MTVPGGVQGHGLVVGFDELAAVGPDDIHHIAIGIASYAKAHTIPGQLRRLLQLLTDLDKLVPCLGKLDLGSLENIHAGDQRRGAHRLGDGIGLALVHDLREDRKEPAWHALHLLHQVSHLQQVSLGAIERRFNQAPSRVISGGLPASSVATSLDSSCPEPIME